ncbi:MAG: 5-(carboxyamino)imidazole ribonucleotide synthase [Synechococcaceae cyanobacterium SM2_3_1]|nr:5-(carboxyamino)imidazole ribonucleotide synthase [Synechococcaceae cyanobacterium SM2_3_1]
MAIRSVGVIGGGQLAQMMVVAAHKLGLTIAVQTPEPTDPAAQVADHVILGSLQDLEATRRLAEWVEVITFENEFVDLTGLQTLVDEGICFRPGLETLSPLLDKYEQYTTLQQWGLPIPQVALPQEPLRFSFPLVLKVRRHGYDGRGTVVITTPEHLQTELKARSPEDVLLQEWIGFERELAVVAARSSTGEIAVYPVVETQQQDQVCRRVIVPATIPEPVGHQIHTLTQPILEKLAVVGLFGIEFFLTPTGEVLINEISPRTHNSGHYTLDACPTSQFEQHLRAMCDLPLGNTSLISPAAVMVNLLGYETSAHDYVSQRQALAAIPHAHVHWYEKRHSHPGRKLGHVTILSPEPTTQEQLLILAQKVEQIWYGQG